MFSFQEQFSAATKSNFEAQIAMITALTSKTFESVEKIVDLNMTAVKASLEESTLAAKQLMTAKDPQEFFTLAASQAQPNSEKAIAYGRHLASIASSAQAEFTKAAEVQMAETKSKVLALVEEVTKNAPTGSENAIAMFKSAVGNANAGYEQISKTTKQAVETFEGNVNEAVGQFQEVAEKNVARAVKK